MKRFTFAVLAMLLTSAAAGDVSDDYRLLLDTLHITSLRAGANGMDPAAPNYANFDETRVGNYTLPDPLKLADGTEVRNANDWWTKRRPEIAGLLETEVYGRVPETAPSV